MHEKQHTNRDKMRQVVEVLRYFKALGFQEIILSSQVSNLKEDAVNQDLQKTAYNATVSETADKSSEQTDSAIKRFSCLKELRDAIKGCSKCKLHSTRTNIVFGEGSEEAEIMFIGEGPGADEDMQGRPFVGKAGQLLTSLIEKLGLTRDTVYIANIVKCRPPKNRDPEEDEAIACTPYLEEQIRIIRPKVIVALGKIATYRLMRNVEPISKFSIMKVRGNFFEYHGADITVPVMPTYHPSYLLRNREAKWDVWNDAQMVMKRIRP